MPHPTLVWLRDDHRLSDHPALHAAAAYGPVIAAAIRPDGLGGAEAWWWERSVQRLAQALSARGVPLIRRNGDAAAVLPALSAETGATAVHWNRRLDPRRVIEEGRVRQALNGQGTAFADDGLFAPDAVTAGRDAPYKVFTAFWKRCLALPEPPPPLPVPVFGACWSGPVPTSDAASAEPRWSAGFGDVWSPGEDGAQARFASFLNHLAAYPGERDRPDREGVSRLSPHLRFGEISPRQIWHAVRAAALADPESAAGAEAYLRELGWREFARHLLHHFPDLDRRPLDHRFESFPWRQDDARLTAWKRGETGYPIVDAGMRQLWQTGWMHNRVRMIAGSFLVKDLLLPWQEGLAWFADTLVDADPASNAMNWQWVAGCGADAAPFFRVFNPTTQGAKFDPDGAYVRRYAPGRTPPIVDHAQARLTALDAFATLANRRNA